MTLNRTNPDNFLTQNIQTGQWYKRFSGFRILPEEGFLECNPIWGCCLKLWEIFLIVFVLSSQIMNGLCKLFFWAKLCCLGQSFIIWKIGTESWRGLWVEMRSHGWLLMGERDGEHESGSWVHGHAWCGSFSGTDSSGHESCVVGSCVCSWEH